MTALAEPPSPLGNELPQFDGGLFQRRGGDVEALSVRDESPDEAVDRDPAELVEDRAVGLPLARLFTGRSDLS